MSILTCQFFSPHFSKNLHKHAVGKQSSFNTLAMFSGEFVYLLMNCGQESGSYEILILSADVENAGEILTSEDSSLISQP